MRVSGLKEDGKPKEKNEGGESWEVVIARLCLSGRTPKQVGELTIKQGTAILDEMRKEFMASARVQGCTFKGDEQEDDNTQVFTDFSEGFNAMAKALG